MRGALYVAAGLAGAAVAALGSEPLWAAVVAALVVFPLAANAADRRSRTGRRRRAAPLLPALLTALAGGLLLALLVRLALAAPGWIDEGSADCGGPSTGTQQLVLWSSAVVFLVAATPIGLTVLGIAGRLPSEREAAVPLVLYPLSVAAAGVALIAAGFVTSC